jgi:hypothetical protein
MPSLLRTNPEIAERKRTASIQRKRMAAVDKAPKEDIRRPLDLEVDDAALDSDHRGVGPVVSAELGQYTSDPALDGLLGE